MTPGAYPGRIVDLTATQRALITVARLDVGLRAMERSALLDALLPDVDSFSRDRRYAPLHAAVSRYDDLLCGVLESRAFLGAQDPDDDADADDRVHAAAIMAWFEVTEAVMRAAPALPVSTVDEHAEQIIAALADPEHPAAVAA